MGMGFEDNLDQMFNCTRKGFRDLEDGFVDVANAEAKLTC